MLIPDSLHDLIDRAARYTMQGDTALAYFIERQIAMHILQHNVTTTASIPAMIRTRVLQLEKCQG